LGGDPHEERNAVHGQATQVEQHSVDLRFEGLTAWDDAGKLIPAPLTELLGLAGGGTVVDEPITLALGTYMHGPPPSQIYTYLSGGKSITGHGHHYLVETLIMTKTDRP
jgi:hypothetical protein